VALAEAQRRALASEIEPWRRPLAIADRGMAAVRFIKDHPAWVVGTAVVGGAVVPGALRTSRVAGWLGRGLAAWRIARRLRDRTPSA
jgi:hypothetical protein